jgi:hypothetical protein
MSVGINMKLLAGVGHCVVSFRASSRPVGRTKKALSR